MSFLVSLKKKDRLFMPWYAVYTRSRHENKVCTGLSQKAHHVFLPKIEVWSRHVSSTGPSRELKE